jgi:hypothetical protein
MLLCYETVPFIFDYFVTLCRIENVHRGAEGIQRNVNAERGFKDEMILRQR